MRELDSIDIEGGTRVTLVWEDGSQTLLSARDLRAACLCAECRTPGGEHRRQLAATGALPVTIIDAHLVGAYAVNFTFAPDGHSTGIFSFSQLAQLASTTEPDGD